MPTQTFFNLPTDKRDLIIDAAIDEFFEKGYEGMSIAKLIERAKIPRGSFYQYFEDKNDIYKYLILHVIGERKHKHSSQKLHPTTEMSFFHIIRNLFINGIEFYKKEPKLATISTEFLRIKDSTLKNEVLGESQRISNDFFYSLIEERKIVGEISKEIDGRMLIYLINSINLSFTEYFLEHENFDSDSTELIEALDKLLYILKHGLQP
ncbi:TetR/AcrR family transcriptional regulator [Fredinandcohnia humi]